MPLDFDILKKHGTTPDQIRKLFTCEDPEQPEYEHRKAFEKRLNDRIYSGIRLSLSNYHLYAAADLAWDSTPIVRENIPLLLYAQKKIKIDRCASELENLGCAENFVRKDADGTIKEIDLPRLYETSINLVRSYVTRRLAAQATQYNNLYPFFKYEARATDLVGKLRADALSQRVEIATDQFGYRHMNTQAIRDMLLYGHTVLFPQCAWEREKAWQKAKVAEGFNSEGADFTVEAKIVREGVDFIRPHPTRVFWDISSPLSSINTDTGCRYLGFWDIKKYQEIITEPGYFNRDKIKISDQGKTTYGSYALFIDSTYTATTIKFTGSAGLRPPANEGMANDRVAMEPFYTQNESDETMFVTQYFERVIPKNCGLGDYPYPVWLRMVVAGDDTVIFAEVMPSTPGVYFGYNENDSRYSNLSMALELAGFQDQVTNLLSQCLLAAKNNALRIVTLDVDLLDEKMRSAIKETLAGKNYYVHPCLLEYSGIKARAVGANPKPLDVIERNTQDELGGYFRAIAQILSLVERMLVLSPQELGQAAPREISATEVSAISSSTQTVYGFISTAVDEGRAAWKKLLYESLIAKGSAEIQVPIVGTYTKETVEKAGFTLVPSDDKQDSQQQILGSKENLVHEYVFSSRDGATRSSNSQSAQVLSTMMNQLLSIPGMLNAVGKTKLYGMVNEVFRLSGAGYDLNLELKDGEPDDFGPPPEQAAQAQQTQQAIGELTRNVQTLGQQVAKNEEGLSKTQSDLGTLVQAIQQALSAQTPMPPSTPPTPQADALPNAPGGAPAPTPYGSGIPV